MNARDVIPVLLVAVGGGIVAASMAQVPAERRQVEWPLMVAVYSVTGLVLWRVLRRQDGRPPGGRNGPKCPDYPPPGLLSLISAEGLQK